MRKIVRRNAGDVDLSSKTAQLCVQGTQAEFERRLDDARALFAQAWDAAMDDYDRSVAAHYVAHLETDAATAHRWNLVALEFGMADPRATEFLGSLYVSLGDTCERLGNADEAEHYFAQAAQHGVEHFRG